MLRSVLRRTPADPAAFPATFTASSVKATDEVRGSATVAEIAISGASDQRWREGGTKSVTASTPTSLPTGFLDREQKRTTAERLVTSGVSATG